MKTKIKEINEFQKETNEIVKNKEGCNYLSYILLESLLVLNDPDTT